MEQELPGHQLVQQAAQAPYVTRRPCTLTAAAIIGVTGLSGCIGHQQHLGALDTLRAPVAGRHCTARAELAKGTTLSEVCQNDAEGRVNGGRIGVPHVGCLAAGQRRQQHIVALQVEVHHVGCVNPLHGSQDVSEDGEVESQARPGVRGQGCPPLCQAGLVPPQHQHEVVALHSVVPHLAHGRVAGEGLQQRHLREHVHQRVPVVHGGGQVRHLQGHPRRVVPQGRRLRPQHLSKGTPCNSGALGVEAAIEEAAAQEAHETRAPLPQAP
mmetsp:Transcript_13200/g.39960  ORF Transcript_13200/g.39960 Transcript_13200/m.39960 type:complete len:269 (-) Transcript_13200:1028-1834(-)